MNKKQINKIGAHVSVAGGIQNAPQRAAAIGCETFQCFTRPPQGGPAPKLTEEMVSEFNSNLKKWGVGQFYIHTPYYINLASLEKRISKSSSRIIREELERASTLGARYIMTHVGSRGEQTKEEGIKKVIGGIKEALDGYFGSAGFLIEISAGAGAVIGDKFEEVGQMVESLYKEPGFAGICFDTCHAFGAGYDFRTPAKAREVLAEFDKYIGLRYLKLTHVNDSKVDLGGRRDRHEHIGDGFIGQEGIASILGTKEFMAIDWLLETEYDKVQEDIKKLKNLRVQKA